MQASENYASQLFAAAKITQHLSWSVVKNIFLKQTMLWKKKQFVKSEVVLIVMSGHAYVCSE